LKVLAGLLEDKWRRWETCDDALLLEEALRCACGCVWVCECVCYSEVCTMFYSEVPCCSKRCACGWVWVCECVCYSEVCTMFYSEVCTL
jgi:hypothetical protein